MIILTLIRVRVCKVMQATVFYSNFIRSKDKMPVERGSISDDKPAGKSKLTLLKVTPADSGDYLCVSQVDKWKTYFHVKIYSK